MPEQTDIQRDLQQLTTELKQLEAEYNGFFAGRLARPPLETRRRVESIIRRWDRGGIETSADRFRFQTLQARFARFADLWDRGQRAREEGRPGPFGHVPPRESRPAPPPAAPDPNRVLCVTAFSDPMREMDKLHSLYDSLMDARRQAGDESVPFHRFAALVKDQVTKLKAAGTGEVAFRVAMKDGKVNFTVKGLKGGSEE